jgi:hypothetical protein
MEQEQEPVEKQARYILVNDIEEKLLGGCARTFRKDLLRSENLEIGQTVIKGSGDAEEYGISDVSRMEYVLDGEATLRQGGTETNIGKGDLLILAGTNDDIQAVLRG